MILKTVFFFKSIWILNAESESSREKFPCLAQRQSSNVDNWVSVVFQLSPLLNSRRVANAISVKPCHFTARKYFQDRPQYSGKSFRLQCKAQPSLLEDNIEGRKNLQLIDTKIEFPSNNTRLVNLYLFGSDCMN
jgi:hypothetical protein